MAEGDNPSRSDADAIHVSPASLEQAARPAEITYIAPTGGEVHVTGSVWQQPWFQNVVPLLTSIALHLGVFLIGWATYEAGAAATRLIHEEQIIVPDAAIVETVNVAALPNPGLGDDPTRAAAQAEFPDAAQQSDTSWQTTPSQTLQTALMGGGEEASMDALIGLGSAGAISSDLGQGNRSGDVSGQMAPFGVPGGGAGIGPRADFMGITGNARKVVLVCDATGTMAVPGIKELLLKREITRALDGLKPIQAFNIIFYQGGETDAQWCQPLSRELLLASPENRMRASEFAQGFQFIGSNTNPLPALRMAFRQKPQLIYFLSDGQFNTYTSYEEVINEIGALNGEKTVKVNTIAFMSEDAEAEQTLQQIAQENGGTFVKMMEKDLN
jgi:hypothetical protein